MNKQWKRFALMPLILIVLCLFRFIPEPDPQNERVARTLVEAAYQTAQSGTTSDLSDSSQWAAIDQKYGRVLSWRIVGNHRAPLSWDWIFDAEVTRERAVTREQVDASAGPSHIYGYRSSINNVEVESVY